MEIAFNIKDEAVHRDARRLADLTGQSLTGAVRDALAARLIQIEHEHAEATGGHSAEAILEAVRGVRAALGAGAHSADHAALYGDDGLPA